jgi:hypothetical protein
LTYDESSQQLHFSPARTLLVEISRMSVRIANREIIQTNTLLIPQGEEVWIEVPIIGWTLRVQLVFATDQQKGEPRITVEAVEKHARITLLNWTNSLGTASLSPVQIATLSDGRKVFFMVWHAQTGKTSKVVVQFMLGDKA